MIQPSQSVQNEQKEIIQQVILRELAWTKAHLDGDLNMIAEIMSEDYLQRQEDGSFKNKKEVLETFKTGKRQWELAESTDHHVQLADQLAIVVGKWRGKGKNHDQHFDYSARFISIFRLENQDWRMILDQSIPCNS